MVLSSVFTQMIKVRKLGMSDFQCQKLAAFFQIGQSFDWKVKCLAAISQQAFARIHLRKIGGRRVSEIAFVFLAMWSDKRVIL